MLGEAMRSMLTFAVLAGLAAALPALADPSERPDNLDACLEAAAGMTMERDFCWSDEYDRVQPLLAPAYDAAMALAEEGQKAGLEQSQKDFLAYRESWCGAKGGFLGSGRNEVYARCMIQLTRERVEALKGFDGP